MARCNDDSHLCWILVNACSGKKDMSVSSHEYYTQTRMLIFTETSVRQCEKILSLNVLTNPLKSSVSIPS